LSSRWAATARPHLRIPACSRVRSGSDGG
jgi:hypothetical protein